MTLCTGSVRWIWGILKKVSRVETRHQTRRVDFRLLAEALDRCHTRWGGGRWKSQNRKIVPLFPYVEKPLNSKVIKSFIPELRSHYMFFVFLDSYVYINEHYMSIYHIRNWLWYNYCKFVTSALADYLSLVSEWQQVSSSPFSVFCVISKMVQFGWSLLVLQFPPLPVPLPQASGDCSEHTNYNWNHLHIS